jgi:hypothetical protein
LIFIRPNTAIREEEKYSKKCKLKGFGAYNLEKLMLFRIKKIIKIKKKKRTNNRIITETKSEYKNK